MAYPLVGRRSSLGPNPNPNPDPNPNPNPNCISSSREEIFSRLSDSPRRLFSLKYPLRVRVRVTVRLRVRIEEIILFKVSFQLLDFQRGHITTSSFQSGLGLGLRFRVSASLRRRLLLSSRHSSRFLRF